MPYYCNAILSTISAGRHSLGTQRNVEPQRHRGLRHRKEIEGNGRGWVGDPKCVAAGNANDLRIKCDMGGWERIKSRRVGLGKKSGTLKKTARGNDDTMTLRRKLKICRISRGILRSFANSIIVQDCDDENDQTTSALV